MTIDPITELYYDPFDFGIDDDPYPVWKRMRAEAPPLHDLHRRLLSRVFTPRRMLAVEDLARDFCSRALDPLRDSDGFDFVPRHATEREKCALTR